MDFDLLAACEGLVGNAFDDFDDICDNDVERWQRLFGFSSFAESRKAIEDWRSDLGRTQISAAAWDLVKAAWPDFDKESYEFALATGKLRSKSEEPSSSATSGARDMSAAKYLMRLEAGLPIGVEDIQEIGKLDARPTVYRGVDDDGEATEFCIMNGCTKARIIEYLSAAKCLIRPTFIRHSEAEKSLSVTSRYPSLGIDMTLPQFRLSDDGQPPLAPGQDEYPVWYFFYGTLGQPEILSRVLNLSSEDKSPVLHPAQVKGGRLTIWGGKYKALVHAEEDGPPVEGWAYLVKSQDEEDALRYYETERYIVVRCDIEFITNGGTAAKRVPGLTFLFLG